MMKGAIQAQIVGTVLFLSLAIPKPGNAQQPSTAITIAKAPGGIEYGIRGKPGTKPAPTLFVFAGTIEGTLGRAGYRQCGNNLAKRGYLLVSIDLPCHGKQATKTARGLSGWSQRIGRNEDIVAEATSRLSRVLDHLIKTGVTDAKRVAACGTSRGGFLALHFAAADSRVKCTAAFAPVTNLAALTEFRGKERWPLVKKLSLSNSADKLAGRPVWIVIGDRDDRVGTRHAFHFSSQLSAAARKKNIPSHVELHILSEPRGHTTPPGSAQQAALWIHHHLTQAPDK